MNLQGVAAALGGCACTQNFQTAVQCQGATRFSHLWLTNSQENMGAKAVLLSGPPGIGKSTLAGIISKHMGYTPYELNASDSRNKAALANLVDITNSLSISHFSSLSINKSSHQPSGVQKRVLIMDEVDGMSSSDRGGIAELIKVIKSSKCPIICICNDRHSQKLKSLVNHCLDMKINRPNKINIVKRLCFIANKEGLQLDPNAAEVLVEQSGNDIRQAINTLQLYKQNFTYSAMKSLMSSCDKDKVLRQTPFDSCGGILSAKGDVVERYNSFFVDYSLVPLLVQQNYIDSARNGIFKQPYVWYIASTNNVLIGMWMTVIRWIGFLVQLMRCQIWILRGHLSEEMTCTGSFSLPKRPYPLLWGRISEDFNPIPLFPRGWGRTVR